MRKLAIALVLLAVWAAATMLPAIPRDGQTTDLTTLLSTGIDWGLVAAPAVLIVALFVLRWDRLGLRAAWRFSDVLLAWPILLLVATALVVAVLVGLPPLSAILFVALNTAFVGFSEELMFRGFLYRGASDTGRFWSAFVLTTLLFGAVHLLNVFITGDLRTVAIQAVSASCSGVLLLAVRLRSGSLYPMILVHWLWDFSVTVVTLSLGANPAAAGGVLPTVVGGLLLAAPAISLILGLYLMRKGRAACPEWSDRAPKALTA
jgi:membrane protease YdiL (CAAX protease family)